MAGKKPQKLKKASGERAFYDELCANPVSTTRITREAINNKHPHREVMFKFEGETVHVYIAPDGDLHLECNWVNGKPNGKYTGDAIPEIFRTRMKYYLSNLGWTLDRIKLVHEAREGTFFETLNTDGELEKEPLVYCGWRGVLFYYVRKGRGHVCAFYPQDGSIERISTVSPEQADDLCCMLSDGICFDCKTKMGPGKFCPYHLNIMRSYGG
jgi:hypothetical protein